ncbi:PAS domain-containing protein [Halovulum dunhuangense]|uniref:PAS domain-containing protein n=1 Tax=Halovulum dunhuangense TaxID=1505036 RepID=A0A849L2G5_9RHOB|nr:PAS domain-containing protein [Halovulum dunhuangense]NNU80469.1 PAS domain-containing protein [Halovulum dunhuangense]
MNTDALTGLRDYWESLRRGRLAPLRSELDPRRFEDALERLFILEQIRPEELRIRLAGLSLCELMGVEVRGMPPEALFDDRARPGIHAHLKSVLTLPAVVELDLYGPDRFGRDIAARMLLLPLCSDLGDLTRVLGCITTAGVMRAPVQFTISAAITTPVRTDDRQGATRQALPGFAEPAQAYGLPPAPPPLSLLENPQPVSGPRRRGHLRLLSGGQDGRGRP